MLRCAFHHDPNVAPKPCIALCHSPVLLHSFGIACVFPIYNTCTIRLTLIVAQTKLNQVCIIHMECTIHMGWHYAFPKGLHMT